MIISSHGPSRVEPGHAHGAASQQASTSKQKQTQTQTQMQTQRRKQQSAMRQGGRGDWRPATRRPQCETCAGVVLSQSGAVVNCSSVAAELEAAFFS